MSTDLTASSSAVIINITLVIPQSEQEFVIITMSTSYGQVFTNTKNDGAWLALSELCLKTQSAE